MSAKDPLTIFLAIMTFISTMTGVAGTFITFAQFRREAAAREAVERENDSADAPQAPGQNLDSPRKKKKAIPAFSVALKSRAGMSVGLILLAVILGVVWKESTANSGFGPSRSAQSATDSSAGAEENSVTINNSQDFLGGQLSIALNSVDVKGDPARAFATFKVVTSDGKSKRIRGEEAGFILDFEGFNVRLLSASAGEARFAVKKKEATP